MFPVKNTQPDQCIKTREKQCRQKPQLAGVDLLGLPIIENPFQNVLPSVFADSLMIIGPDGADSQRSQGDRKIGKDERLPSLFYVIQTGWIFFRTEGHAGEKEKGWHVECVNPPEYGVVHGHNVTQHHQKQGEALGNIDVTSSIHTHW